MQRFTMLLMAVTIMTSVGCANSGGSAEESAGEKSAISDVETPIEIEPFDPAIDYSKVSCGENSACASVCMILKPHTTISIIEVNFCKGYAGTATCESLLRINDTATQDNVACEDLPITAVIDPVTFDSSACGDSFQCRQICEKTYKPKTDKAIERAYAATGGSPLKELLANQFIREKLNACLAAPSDYVLN